MKGKLYKAKGTGTYWFIMDTCITYKNHCVNLLCVNFSGCVFAWENRLWLKITLGECSLGEWA